MDRRRFLANATKAACGLGLAFAGLPEVFASEEVRRPRPEVTVRAVFVRPPGKYWLGWPGTSYDVEGHRRDYTTQLIESGRRVGVNVIPNLEPLYSDQDVDKFVAQLKQTRPDGVVVTLLHIGQWPWVQKIAAAGIPTIVFSPIGTSFTGHVVGFSRQPGVYVVSSLELAAVEYGLKMIQTASYLKQCRVLLIRGAERSDSVIDRLGINVRAIPRRAFSDLYDQMPLTDEVRDIAADYGRRARKIVEPTAQDRLNAAKVYTTARKLLAQENATSLAMDCLGMVADRQVPTPPCMAWSKLNDEGITAACEADLFAAVSLMLVSHLFDQPGFMQDPVAETAQNLLVAAHCTCATKLNGFDKPSVPFILRSHSESDIGVSMQVLWEEGRKVTLVRFTGPDQVIVDSGTIVGNVQTPPAGGCRTSLEIRMDDVADARDVKGFHQVVFYGDHGKQVRDYCQLYGIQAISSA
jgi:hypothetical protein